MGVDHVPGFNWWVPHILKKRGDSMSVMNNTSKPESVLKKKNNSVCYHIVRESVAMG